MVIIFCAQIARISGLFRMSLHIFSLCTRWGNDCHFLLSVGQCDDLHLGKLVCLWSCDPPPPSFFASVAVHDSLDGNKGLTPLTLQSCALPALLSAVSKAADPADSGRGWRAKGLCLVPRTFCVQQSLGFKSGISNWSWCFKVAPGPEACLCLHVRGPENGSQRKQMLCDSHNMESTWLWGCRGSFPDTVWNLLRWYVKSLCIAGDPCLCVVCKVSLCSRWSICTCYGCLFRVVFM